MTQSNDTSDTSRKPFRVIEMDDAGWAAFKALEAQHRKKYAASSEAISDHQRWVDSSAVRDNDWGSIPPDESQELDWPEMIPHPTQPALDQLTDFSQPK